MRRKPCKRKDASTLKTSAILVASLVGLWLGIIGQVSASTESDSERWVAPTPSAEDCGTGDDNVVTKWRKILVRYNGYLLGLHKDINYTLDAFKTDMNDLLTVPKLINCGWNTNAYYAGQTIANQAAVFGSVEGAKWAVSKGADLTITRYNGLTAYDTALAVLNYIQSAKYAYWFDKLSESEKEKMIAKYIQVAQILKPPPAEATESCAEVDGQTPPANEYCIVAENMQESFKARLVVPGFDGYEHKTTAVSSGVGFRKDWKSTIIFTCRAPAGQSCEGLPYADDPLGLGIDADNFELYVRCGNTINLLDVDSITAGNPKRLTS